MPTITLLTILLLSIKESVSILMFALCKSRHLDRLAFTVAMKNHPFLPI